ncbi:hypothetical protein [Streptomyces sp. NPDC005799]|uniref:hypothetical protein n=1 Tax=Streptomyces sp. NPDC005799 TaxID=3154678 RepID=UPI0033CC765D
MTEHPTGPRCGNNPNTQLTGGDQRVVDEFRAFLDARSVLRDRIVKVLAATELKPPWPHCLAMADAVLSVLPAPADQGAALREAEQRQRPNTPPSRPEPHIPDHTINEEEAPRPVKQRADCTELEWAEQERARFERLYTRETVRGDLAEQRADTAARDADIYQQRLERLGEGYTRERKRAEKAEADANHNAGLVADAVQRAERAEAALERARGIQFRTSAPDCNSLARAQDNGWNAALHWVRKALDGPLDEPAAEARGNDKQDDRETLAALFEGFGRLLATSSRDWGQYAPDAWLYAVILGWDCEETEHDETCTHGAMEEMAARHGWDAEAVAKARRYRAVVRALTESAAVVRAAEPADTQTQTRALLFWDATNGASLSDSRITIPVDKAANLAEFTPAGVLILQIPDASALRATLTTLIAEATEAQQDGAQS